MINEHMSTVIISIVTGIVTILTLLIQKKNDKIITKINDQTSLIEQETNLKRDISNKKREIESTIYEIQVLLIDMNLSILNQDTEGRNLQDLSDRADRLKNEFSELNNILCEMLKEYNMVVKYNSVLKKELSSRSDD